MPIYEYMLDCDELCSTLVAFHHCKGATWQLKEYTPKSALYMSDEVLAWLSVWSKVQMTCIWFS